MSASETPIFPGKIQNKITNIAASTTATYTIFEANNDNGGIVTGINLHEKGTGAVNLRLEITDGSDTAILWQGSTSGTTDTSTNILNSVNVPLVDADTPELKLAPGHDLQLVVENSVANAIDVYTTGGDYTYPNT